jgi:hypothetical protein
MNQIINNSIINNNIYLVIIIVILIQFIWYYLTLPGSILSLNKKTDKPQLKKALSNYIIYIFPMIIGIYFLNLKDKNCDLIKSYISSIYKK